jgi:hypothetical protein
VVYHTDCRFVSDGFAAGRAGTTLGHHTFADLWIQVWDKIEDIGIESVGVVWNKGHASQKDVQAGKILAWQRQGNRHADKQAKCGAALHPSVAATKAKHDVSFKVVTIIARFMARIGVRAHAGPYDATPDRMAQYYRTPKEPRRRATRESQHEPVRCGDVLICWRCCKAARCKANLLRAPCTPIGDNSHSLWALGPHIFCSKCGARTATRLRLLKSTCAGAPGSATQARLLSLLKRGIVPPGTEIRFGRPVPCIEAFAREGETVQPPLNRVDPLESVVDAILSTAGLLGEAPVGPLI